MLFTSGSLMSDDRQAGGVLERRFSLGDVPGILWTPPSGPAPVILMGHPGDLDRMYPRLAHRAEAAVAAGFAAATIELPGAGGRPGLAGVDEARAELQHAVRAGQPVPDDVVDRLVLPLVEAAVPEWEAVIDALLALREVDGPVGFSGGVTAIGLRLARVERRVAAVLLFAGSYVPRRMLAEAREVRTPLLLLLQWDDAGNDRQAALDLFDTIGSPEKTLHANVGGHTGVPAFENDDTNRFFGRHVR